MNFIPREIKAEASAVANYSIVDTICYTESILLGDPSDFLSNVPAPDWIMRLPSLRRWFCRSTVPWNILQK